MLSEGEDAQRRKGEDFSDIWGACFADFNHPFPIGVRPIDPQGSIHLHQSYVMNRIAFLRLGQFHFVKPSGPNRATP